MGQLDGKVVAITGGARGIGEATAKQLATLGARVAVGDLDAELAQASAAEYGGLGLPLDVTSRESFVGFLDKVEAEFGRIDVLVNNAGIMVIGPVLEVPLDDQLRQLDINLKGVIHGCHAVVPKMLANGGGQIVNIASLAGVIAPPGAAVYTATKAGVLGLSEGLDAELAPQGIRVGAILPTFTNTHLTDGTTAPRLSPHIEPETVAAEVVRTIRRHRQIGVAPRSMSYSVPQWRLLPMPVKRWIGRKTGMDSMFITFDRDARSGYFQRTRRS